MSSMERRIGIRIRRRIGTGITIGLRIGTRMPPHASETRKRTKINKDGGTRGDFNGLMRRHGLG